MLSRPEIGLSVKVRANINTARRVRNQIQFIIKELDDSVYK